MLETKYEKSEAVRTTEHFMEQVMQGRKRRAESADFLSAALNLSAHFYVGAGVETGHLPVPMLYHTASPQRLRARIKISPVPSLRRSRTASALPLQTQGAERLEMKSASENWA